MPLAPTIAHILHVIFIFSNTLLDHMYTAPGEQEKQQDRTRRLPQSGRSHRGQGDGGESVRVLFLVWITEE